LIRGVATHAAEKRRSIFRETVLKGGGKKNKVIQKRRMIPTPKITLPWRFAQRKSRGIICHHFFFPQTARVATVAVKKRNPKSSGLKTPKRSPQTKRVNIVMTKAKVAERAEEVISKKRRKVRHMPTKNEKIERAGKPPI